MKYLPLVTALCLLADRAAHAAEITSAPPAWQAQPVCRPLEPARVQPMPWRCPAGEIDGAVTVGPDRAAAFWIGALDLVRVRAASDVRLQFARVVGERGARAVVAEPGVAAGDRAHYLVQPPGGGDVWIVTAERPVEIAIDHPLPPERSGADWRRLEQDLLAWIERGGELPPLFGARAVALGHRLVAERELAGALAGMRGASPGVQRAALEWRRVSALAGLSQLAPLARPFFSHQPLTADLAGIGSAVDIADAADSERGRAWHVVRAARGRWDLAIEGPAMLRVEARSVGPCPASPDLVAGDGEAAIHVRRGDDSLARLRFARVPAIVSEPGALPVRRAIPVAGGCAGRRQVATVPVAPGAQRIELAVDGGPLLLRVLVARARPRLGGARLDTAWQRGRDAIAGDRSPAATLARALLDRAAGLAVTGERPAVDGASPAIAALAQIVFGPPDARAVARALGAEPSTTAWYLRLEAMRAVDDLRALLAAAPSPPAWTLPTLAERMPPASVSERATSRELAALDLAWRHAPADPELRARAVDAWRQRSAWRLLARADDTAPAARWLERLDLPGAAEPGDPDLLARLGAGDSAPLRAPTSAIDPARLAVVTAYVRTPDRAADIAQLSVDRTAVPVLGVEPAERVDVAVEPGDHRIALTGPAGTEAFVALPPGAPARPAAAARIRTLWPASARFSIPDPELPAIAWIHLRAPAAASRAGQRAVVRTDAGQSWPIEWTARPADPRLDRLDGAPSVSGAVAFAVRLPPGARAIWVEAAGDSPLFGAVSVRGIALPPRLALSSFAGQPQEDRRAEPPDARTRARLAHTVSASRPTRYGLVDGSDAVARLAALGRELASPSATLARLAERAMLLCELGQTELARQDVLRLARRGRAPSLAPIVDELESRLDAAVDASHVARGAAAAPPLRVIRPAVTLSLADARAVLPVIRIARERGPAAALRALGADDRRGATALRARLHDAAGRPVDAARELLSLRAGDPSWSIGLGWAERLLRARADGRFEPGEAGIAHGLALQLSTEQPHPVLASLGARAASASRWQAVTRTETAAGRISAVVDRESALYSMSALSRRAVLASPWPDREAALVSGGRGTALDLQLDAPTAVAVDLYCGAVYGDGLEPPCRIEHAIDDGAVARRSLPVRQVTRLELGRLAAGHHQIELRLAGRRHLAAARFVTDRPLPETRRPAVGSEHVVEARRPVRLHTATPRQPVSITLLGPTTLWVQARGAGDRAPTRIDIQTDRDPAPASLATSLAIDAALDPSATPARGAPPLSRPVDTLVVIAQPGPVRVTLRPDRGTAALRMAWRDDRTAAPPPRRPAFRQRLTSALDRPELVRWPERPDAIAPLGDDAVSPVSAFGTLTLAGSIGRDDLADREQGRADTVIELRAAWQRRIGRSVLRVSPFARTRADAEPAYGGRVDLALRGGPGGTWIDASALAAVQSVDGASARGLRAAAQLARPVDLAPDLVLVPRLGMRIARPDTGVDSLAPGLDPDVADPFALDHRFAATARLQLEWRPLLDHAIAFGGGVFTNPDLAPDHVDAGVEWRSLLATPIPTFARAAYRPALWLADDHRADTTLRQDLSLALEWALWTGQRGRFLISAGCDLLLGLPGEDGARTDCALGLRYDLVSGRGLRDLLPGDIWFREMGEP